MVTPQDQFAGAQDMIDEAVKGAGDKDKLRLALEKRVNTQVNQRQNMGVDTLQAQKKGANSAYYGSKKSAMAPSKMVDKLRRDNSQRLIEEADQANPSLVKGLPSVHDLNATYRNQDQVVDFLDKQAENAGGNIGKRFLLGTVIGGLGQAGLENAVGSDDTWASRMSRYGTGGLGTGLALAAAPFSTAALIQSLGRGIPRAAQAAAVAPEVVKHVRRRQAQP